MDAKDWPLFYQIFLWSSAARSMLTESIHYVFVLSPLLPPLLTPPPPPALQNKTHTQNTKIH